MPERVTLNISPLGCRFSSFGRAGDPYFDDASCTLGHVPVLHSMKSFSFFEFLPRLDKCSRGLCALRCLELTNRSSFSR